MPVIHSTWWHAQMYVVEYYLQVEEAPGKEGSIDLTELARREKRIRAEQDKNRSAKRGTVTEEQRKRKAVELTRAMRKRHWEQDREQL